MTVEVISRRYRDSDAAALTALLNSSYQELQDRGLNFTAATQDIETTRRRVADGRCWVVEDHGQIAATLTMSVPPADDIRALSDYATQPRTGWLCQVAVAPALRGRAMSQRLFEVACNWARHQDITTVGLDTAAPAEHLAAMYSRWGFERVDTVQFPGKAYASVVMTMALPDPGN
jgi:N-acetylglutamate synthase-like GNAT family acetyltransferase